MGMRTCMHACTYSFPALTALLPCWWPLPSKCHHRLPLHTHPMGPFTLPGLQSLVPSPTYSTPTLSLFYTPTTLSFTHPHLDMTHTLTPSLVQPLLPMTTIASRTPSPPHLHVDVQHLHSTKHLRGVLQCLSAGAVHMYSHTMAQQRKGAAAMSLSGVGTLTLLSDLW